jgi:hypothetical protein
MNILDTESISNHRAITIRIIGWDGGDVKLRVIQLSLYVASYFEE